MATTYRDLMNRVLRKLGEPEINGSHSLLVDDYEILVGDIINDVKDEVENAFQWRALRQTVSVTIPANTLSVNIPEANEQTRLVRSFQQHRGSVLPLVFDVTDANNPDPIWELDLPELLYRDAIDPTERTEWPNYFCLDNSSGDALDIYVWPRPNNQRTLQVTLTIPQDRLAPGDLDTVIKVPVRPIYVGAVWHAMEERGEELGTNGMFNEARFNESLSTAIARDSAESGDYFELVRV